jgi:hypothetical protein
MPEGFLSFVQLPGFTSGWKWLGLSDDDLVALEQEIMRSPLKAPVVGGTGGARKMRFAPPSWRRGKRGGTRVVYFFFQRGETVFLLGVYEKNDQAEMTRAERDSAREIIGWVERKWPGTRRG